MRAPAPTPTPKPESNHSYVSTEDSDDVRKRKYHERLKRTKVRLELAIADLRAKDAHNKATNDRLRQDINDLSKASVDLRRVNTELQQEYRRCQVAHKERKAKLQLLHEREMKKLQAQVVSSRVQERKLALEDVRNREAIEKEKKKGTHRRGHARTYTRRLSCAHNYGGTHTQNVHQYTRTHTHTRIQPTRKRRRGRSKLPVPHPSASGSSPSTSRSTAKRRTIRCGKPSIRSFRRRRPSKSGPNPEIRSSSNSFMTKARPY